MLLNNSGQILSVGFDNIAVKLVRNRFCIHCEGGGGGGLVTKLCPTLATPWTVACRAPLSMGLPRSEHWNGLPCLPLGDLFNPGINLGFLHCRQILYQMSHHGNPSLS